MKRKVKQYFSAVLMVHLKKPEEDMKWYVRDDIQMIKHIHQIILKKLNLKILVRLYPSTNYTKNIK